MNDAWTHTVEVAAVDLSEVLEDVVPTVRLFGREILTVVTMVERCETTANPERPKIFGMLCLERTLVLLGRWAPRGVTFLLLRVHIHSLAFFALSLVSDVTDPGICPTISMTRSVLNDSELWIVIFASGSCLTVTTAHDRANLVACQYSIRSSVFVPYTVPANHLLTSAFFTETAPSMASSATVSPL